MGWLRRCTQARCAADRAHAATSSLRLSNASAVLSSTHDALTAVAGEPFAADVLVAGMRSRADGHVAGACCRHLLLAVFGHLPCHELIQASLLPLLKLRVPQTPGAICCPPAPGPAWPCTASSALHH